MNTAKLIFDPTGWLEINYIQTIQLPDVVVPDVPAVLDEDGNEVTPAVPETTTPGGTKEVVLQCTSYHPTQLELIHADCLTHGVTIEGDDATAVAQWVADYVPPAPVVLTPEQLLEKAKADRASLVEAIVVTTASGKVFDGNEKAQDRMGRSITAMDEADELPWVLHDNSIAVVGRTELREALRLAGAAMAAIWIAPYTAV